MRPGRAITGALVAIAACTNVPPSPPVVEIQPAEPATGDALRAVVVEPAYDLQDDALSYRYRWLRGGIEVSDQVGDTVPAEETRKGEIWRVEVFASDGLAEGPPHTVEVKIGNTAPTVVASISPSNPLTSNDLSCDTTVSDADPADTHSVTVTWYVDDAAVDVAPTLPHARTAKGDRVWCSAVAHDGTDPSEPGISATIVIGNQAPSVVSVEITPSEARRGVDLGARVEGDDLEDDPITWSYTWTLDGTAVATTPVLPGSALTRGQQVAVEVVPNDGQVDGAPRTSAPVTVLNTPPAVGGVSISPATCTTDDVLTATASDVFDIDLDEVGLTWTWSVDGRDAREGPDATLDGARYFKKHDAVTVTVTPNDGFEDGTSVTSSPLTVDNSAPSVTSAAVSATELYEATVVTCDATGWSDADSDDEDYDVAWYVGGTLASTSATGTGAVWGKGDEVYCVLTPNDGETTGTPVTSATLTVLDTLPTAPEVEIDPEHPKVSDDMECVVTVDSEDEDGDTITYSTTWTFDGSSSTWSGSTLSADDNAEGEWTCTVTPNDGEGDGPSASATATAWVFGGWLDASYADAAFYGEGSDDHAGIVVLGGMDLDGDGDGDVVISANLHSTDPNIGGVYVLHGPFSGDYGLASSADALILGSHSAEYLGDSVLYLGDTDGDGYGDLLIGAPLYPYGYYTGAAWLVPGPFTSMGEVAAEDVATAAVYGSNANDRTGQHMVLLGDLGADGADDFALSSTHYDSSAGGVWVLEGPITGSMDVNDDATVLIEGGTASQNVGSALCAPGDLDGDGDADLAFGGYAYQNSRGYGTGAAFVFYATTLSGTLDAGDADALWLGVSTDDYAGYSIASAGDWDDDGTPDLVVGAPNVDDGSASSVGAVYVVSGDASGSSLSLGDAMLVVLGTDAGDRLGAGVSTTGDVDLDGVDDAWVYASASPGAVYLIPGGSEGTLDLEDVPAERHGGGSDAFGQGFDDIGDLGTDGRPDMLIGAPYEDTNGNNAGAVYLFLNE